ncbi:protein PHR1-LIKE 3-like isoform X1 [Camellia sinensis]|uniref:protein PHR1-LIKE 3-like isoform X1 n=1 Tax=Camellia sinensis TaxID=4442 RepID=UPI00103589AE|nr:protein PHR1-LIKE 3-like isoform X1 [Camellia sinensis]
MPCQQLPNYKEKLQLPHTQTRAQRIKKKIHYYSICHFILSIVFAKKENIKNRTMGHQQQQHVQNQDTSLVLSSDAKPRLKWTPELHRRFVDAVTQFGGADKATPKALMRMMSIPGLTLYHLKSHLQKYRLGKSQHSETYQEINQQDYEADPGRDVDFNGEAGDETPNQINDSLQIAQALQVQMEVQRKLHEQIEVQRHLQLRIEAQGKYLQSVLKKAQETLAEYNASSVGVEIAKAELSQLVSMVDNGCQSSLSSVLTDIGGPSPKDAEKNHLVEGTTGCSSSESSGRMQEKCNDNSVVLSLMDLSPRPNQSSGRKRRGSTISDGNCDEKQSKSDEKLNKFGLKDRFDLNIQYLD